MKHNSEESMFTRKLRAKINERKNFQGKKCAGKTNFQKKNSQKKNVPEKTISRKKKFQIEYKVNKSKNKNVSTKNCRREKKIHTKCIQFAADSRSLKVAGAMAYYLRMAAYKKTTFQQFDAKTNQQITEHKLTEIVLKIMIVQMRCSRDVYLMVPMKI